MMPRRLTVRFDPRLLGSIAALLLMVFAASIATCLICDTEGCCEEETRCNDSGCPDANECHCACALIGITPVSFALSPHFEGNPQQFLDQAGSHLMDRANLLDRPPRLA